MTCPKQEGGVAELKTQKPGFDWGSGCIAGQGCFTIDLPEAGKLADIGLIPAGKYDVWVNLDSLSDLDISLYDVGGTSKFKEGTAVVAWCGTSDCNLGVLGSDGGKKSAEYKGMQVEYSGYNGVDGNLGQEYIRLYGETTTPLMMRAFAFQAGKAKVTYGWGVSPCCRGLAPCGGVFKTPVLQGTIVDVGEIPMGKINLTINLTSDTGADIDMQLYDLVDDTKFKEGRAIVAWCGFECNQGVLFGATEESARYPNTTSATALKNTTVPLYKYSGYNGIKNLGDESISIIGKTDRLLMMKVYGYDAGEASVSYTYWNSRM